MLTKGTLKSSVLTLSLYPESLKKSRLNVYHCREIEWKKGTINLFIIGESHCVSVEDRVQGTSLSEKIACASSSDDDCGPVLEKNLLSLPLQKNTITINSFRHEINCFSAHFSDPFYESKIKAIIHKGQESISYNFSTGKRDRFTDLYDPVTLVTLVNEDTGLEWASVHIYPEEEQSVITQTRLIFTK